MEIVKEVVDASLAKLEAKLGGKPRRERRTWTVRCDGPADEGVRVLAKLHSDGTARTEVYYSVPDGKKRRITRGATEYHDTIEAAKKHQEKLVATLTSPKHGWTLHESSRGFEKKPDAFDAAHLPVAKKK